MVFEDAPSGIRSAKSGGMSGDRRTTTYRAEELIEADSIIPSLEACGSICGQGSSKFRAE